MSFVTRLLASIFPFLFSALQRSYDMLTEEQQEALKNSGSVGQLLKNNLTMLGSEFVQLVAINTSLSPEAIENVLIILAGKFGFTAESVDQAVDFLQQKLTKAASDEEWNGLLTIFFNAGGTALSGGSLNWTHIALGLGEWIYLKIISKIEFKALPQPAAPASTPNNATV